MPQNAASVKDTIAAKLAAALDPVSLDVIDESHQHAGHALHPGGVEPRGETHFRIKVVSPRFAGKSRIERHRMINDLVAAELAAGVHALAIEARAPDEQPRK
jgi:BolA protein